MTTVAERITCNDVPQSKKRYFVNIQFIYLWLTHFRKLFGIPSNSLANIGHRVILLAALVIGDVPGVHVLSGHSVRVSTVFCLVHSDHC